MRLPKEFYNKDARVLAKDLLGKRLVRIVDGKVMKSKIVETEAYIGAIDKACHAYGGKKTERLEPLYGEAGIRYVYFVYGMHYCFNIISGALGEPEGVLIRAVEPLEGDELMAINRYNKPLNELTKTQLKNLTNGPAKLCKALLIDKSDNKKSVIDAEDMYLEENDTIEQFKIVEAKRIGIDYAEEAKDFLWRYYIKDNSYVSKV